MLLNKQMHLLESTQRSKLCDNCHLVVAEYACNTCKNELFCSKCFQTVHALSVMQKHQGLSIGENLSEMVPCEIHIDEKLKYWCRGCNILICRDCLLFEHKDHKYALIIDVAKELETKVSTSFISRKFIVRYFLPLFR
jgi:hypothetical protein